MAVFEAIWAAGSAASDAFEEHERWRGGIVKAAGRAVVQWLSAPRVGYSEGALSAGRTAANNAGIAMAGKLSDLLGEPHLTTDS